jgi:PIN domain nuclease of toxin-antitoxin system
LSEWGREALLDEANEIHLSVANWWELIVKRGRADLDFPGEDSFLPEAARRLGVERVIEIGPRHVLELARLPPLHRDPFDRILVAQARAEKLVLMTKDAQVKAYPVRCVW